MSVHKVAGWAVLCCADLSITILLQELFTKSLHMAIHPVRSQLQEF